MSFDVNKFSSAYPEEQVKKGIEAAKASEDYPEVPDGEYTTKIDKIELAESSRTGAALLKAQFRILEGDHARQCIFYSRVLTGTKNDGFAMVQALRFLKSLEAVNDEEVRFEGWRQFNDLVMDINDIVFDDNMRFLVDYVTDEKNPKYKTVSVVMVL